MLRGNIVLGIVALAAVTVACGPSGATDAGGAQTSTTTRPSADQPTTTDQSMPQDEPSEPPREPTSWSHHTYGANNGQNGPAVIVPVPEGWTMTEDGDKVDYRDPSGQMLLRLNLEPNLPGDPIDVFAAQEAEQSSQFPDYTKGGINAAPIGVDRDALEGATWDFQFNKDGTTRTVIIGGFHPFADDVWLTIYFSAPSPVWSDLVSPIFWHHATHVSVAG